MSFHLHLRAVPADGLPATYQELADLMWAAWEDHATEYAAGVAESVEKSFGHLDDLYTEGAAGDVRSRLAVFGGRVVAAPDRTQPPITVLDPVQVGEVAQFLRTVSFDALWQMAVERAAPYAGPPTDGVPYPGGTALCPAYDPRSDFLAHHQGLAAFYDRAALRDRAVVKALWF